MPEFEHRFDGLIFNWNENKAIKNTDKHGVTFEEAATVFKDINAQIYFDSAHSGAEERFILLGCSAISRLLIVCHCYRGADDEVIRIISARKATAQERKEYETRR